jgi:hypothetical protein
VATQRLPGKGTTAGNIKYFSTSAILYLAFNYGNATKF